MMDFERINPASLKVKKEVASRNSSVVLDNIARIENVKSSLDEMEDSFDLN